MRAILGSRVLRRMTPVVAAALLALAALVARGVLAGGATAQPPSNGNGAARFDDLRELNNKLSRAITSLERELPKIGSTIKDTGHWRRVLNDLEATKLRAVDQFPDVFGLPYGETFRQLSCIDDQIAVGRTALLELEKDYVTGPFKGRYFASLRVLDGLK
ncbi:MAG TPA: hypothetical protein VKR21_02855, partial [Solirubrobacteraceae bacterium]|nr:hypothetical protein [Solirubrobacteraceae bacterium]